MKTIKFTPQLTLLIKQGKKTTTFRLFDEKTLSKGDDVILATRNGEKITNFANAIITDVSIKTLETLSKEDYVGHEPIPNEDRFKYYSQFYGDRVRPNSEVKIIRFQITKFLIDQNSYLCYNSCYVLLM